MESAYLTPLLESVLKAPKQRPTSSELLIRLSIGQPKHVLPPKTIAEQGAKFVVPEIYVCNCSDDEPCDHQDEPVADKTWYYCYDCAACYDHRCCSSVHRPKQNKSHKRYILPPAAPVEFGEVIERLQVNPANGGIVLGESACCGLVKAFTLEG